MSDIVGTSIHSALLQTFRRYLFTAHKIAESEPELRDAFWQALGRDRFIAQHPILTSIPAYATGMSLRELASRQSAPKVHRSLLGLGEADRPLYEHQVSAITSIQQGRSVVIGTGTGSGKTESFLLPILDDVVRHRAEGVRAIVVYPLNALANDQLRRLRQILAGLPEITFGRYTGESPQSIKEMAAADLAEVLRPNERVTRDEMRAAPPHVVLTNFAMLEYLLLRPQDSPLFDAGTIRYVVLDEAHVYQGAQGIDVGLLMRRLNRRVGRPLQYILTSATLGGDVSSIQEFAYNLTGTRVSPEDIIAGRTTTAFEAVEQPRALDYYRQFVPDDAALDRWAARASEPALLGALLRDAGLGQVEPSGSGLYEWLHRDARLARLHWLLSDAPRSLRDAAQVLWEEDSDDARRVTEWLCVLGARASRDAASSPLLPARYHYLFRGLRGATVCLSKGCSGHSPSRSWSHLMLEARLTCERCDTHVLPMVTCFTCGLPVCRVSEATGGMTWQELPPGGGSGAQVHLLTWSQVLDDGPEGGEEVESTGEESITLCMSCRKFAIPEPGEPCCVAPQQVTLRRLRSSEDGHLKRCPNCGSEARGFPSVLREFATGEDAAGAVLLEELLRVLPDENPAKPAGGRRVLAFSDSRQRAAFFAPYLSRTTGETQVMAPLLQAIDAVVARDERSATVDEIAREFVKIAERQPFVILRKPLDDSADEFKATVKRGRGLAADDRTALRRDVSVALLRHMVAAPRRRDTLTGLALAAVEYDLSPYDQEQLRSRLPRLSQRFDERTCSRISQALLRIVVRRQALQWPDAVHPSMLGPGANQVTMHRSDAGSSGGRQRIRWNSYRAQVGVAKVVRRSPQIAVLAACLAIDDPVLRGGDVEPLLEEFWEGLVAAEILREAIANEYVLPYDRLIFVRRPDWSKCGRCGAVIPAPPAGRCDMPGCGGSLARLEPAGGGWERDHQRRRFTHSGALPVVVKEHTAQLTQSIGREYQRGFTEGDINVLSCSTTFEMGVDVGQLRAVYLRNVPPTAANYIQRAGRAGRRREGVAVALTFARNLPHDQATYHDSADLLSGTIGVPRVSMKNPKLAQRHANAWMLASFVKSALTVQDNATVDDFFFQSPAGQSPCASYAGWVDGNREVLEAELEEVLRDSAREAPDALRESVRGLTQVATTISEELQAFTQQAELLQAELQAIPEDPVAAAMGLKRIRALMRQLLEERLIDKLSSEHWLPSYAFPQDVVRLRVMDAEVASRFKLERDAEYGISEYAPGAEVIADGRLIQSGALDLRGRTAHVRRYRICGKCHNVEVSDREDSLEGPCTVCNAVWKGVAGLGRPFVVPRGFSTVFEKKAQEVRLYRTLPPRNTEVFLVRGAAPDAFAMHPDLRGLSFGLQQDGQLFLANAGPKNRGFMLCLACGRHAPRGGSHRSPWGARCIGSMTKNDLAYEFETDTLQIRFGGISPRVPPITDESFWSSFEVATVSAASEHLKISARDINATHRAQQAGGHAGELVIYDRVPGGAGYVKRIVEDLPAILEKTLERVRDCKNPLCDIQGSCVTCLRSYYNQMRWDKLRRQSVVEWLGPALEFMTRP